MFAELLLLLGQVRSAHKSNHHLLPQLFQELKHLWGHQLLKRNTHKRNKETKGQRRKVTQEHTKEDRSIGFQSKNVKVKLRRQTFLAAVKVPSTSKRQRMSGWVRSAHSKVIMKIFVDSLSNSTQYFLAACHIIQKGLTGAARSRFVPKEKEILQNAHFPFEKK